MIFFECMVFANQFYASVLFVFESHVVFSCISARGWEQKRLTTPFPSLAVQVETLWKLFSLLCCDTTKLQRVRKGYYGSFLL